VKRSNLIVIALCAAVLAAGAVVYVVVFRDERPTEAIARPAPPPRPPEDPPARGSGGAFELVEVTGTVEVRRGDAWVPVARGDQLSTNESIRTAKGSRAVLRTPAGDELVLRERVELAVGELGSTVTELTLLRGRVKAAAGAGTERLQISAKGATAVAPGGSRFTVYSDTRGAVAVASEQGDVKVLAKGESVTVGTGMQTSVAPGKAPGKPQPVAAEVFLSVAWPKDEIHETKTTLRGKTTPGTEVTVNGEPASVLEDGRFEITVPLRPGKNKVMVLAESIDGKVRDAKGNVIADAPPPGTDPNVGHFPPPKAP